ncbi:MAG: hypothetical protein A2020_15215 [Lentisphaerae bacterium GWF2_45_14]|nr:MAG: hypothetical protein A2020_15215 [Lentisphaerae bacterium GWF2_45_14]
MTGRRKRALIHLADATLKFGKDCTDLLSFTGELADCLYHAVKNPKKIRWRETLYYMDMCGSDALPIVGAICFLMGLILGFQTAVQMAKYGGDIYTADLVAYSITKELGALMVAMIATGRAGSAFAAEIGTMKVSEEIDAMATMGFVPFRFLVVPKIIAMVTVIPILTVFGDIAGIFGGFIVGTLKLGIPAITYFNRTIEVLTAMAFVQGIVKSAVFALIIGCVGCMRGFQSSCDAQGVGRSATSAVVTSIFMVVIADAVLTFLFTSLGY